MALLFAAVILCVVAEAFEAFKSHRGTPCRQSIHAARARSVQVDKSGEIFRRKMPHGFLPACGAVPGKMEGVGVLYVVRHILRADDPVLPPETAE